MVSVFCVLLYLILFLLRLPFFIFLFIFLFCFFSFASFLKKKRFFAATKKKQVHYPWRFLPVFSGHPSLDLSPLLCWAFRGLVHFDPNLKCLELAKHLAAQHTFSLNRSATSRLFFCGGPCSPCVTELGSRHCGTVVVWASVRAVQGIQRDHRTQFRSFRQAKPAAKTMIAWQARCKMWSPPSCDRSSGVSLCGV